MSFDNIIGQPTDSDIFRLFEAMTHILLTIPYDEAHGKHSLIGLIYSKAEYMAEFTDEFPRPSKPGIYDITIPDDAPDGLRAMKEASTRQCAAIMASMRQLSEDPANSS